MLSMPFMKPSAPDFEFSSEWRSSVATTSSAVTVLPLWNSIAVADLERPHLGVVGRSDLLGDAVFQLAVGRQLDDHFAPHLAEGERHLGHEQRRVEAVGGFAADQAGLQDAALDRGLRRGRRWRAANWRRWRRRRAPRRGQENHAGSVCRRRRGGSESRVRSTLKVPHSVGFDRGHSFFVVTRILTAIVRHPQGGLRHAVA